MAKRREEEPKAGAPEWMATFADLATLLMCFFVLLYSMSSIDQSKFQQLASSFQTPNSNLLFSGGSSGISNLLGNGIVEMPRPEGSSKESTEQFDTASQEMQSMASDFKTYFAENNLQDRVEVQENDKYVELVLKDGLLFDKGKDLIKQEAIPILQQISDLLLSKYPNSDIEITGHTDNDPIHVPRFPDNWYLSAARAINVGNFFINDKGFSPKKISAKGRGEFDPIVPNDTEENKSKNRRVEIKLYSSFYSGENSTVY